MVRVVVVGSLLPAKAHIDDSDPRCDGVGILGDPVQAGDQVFIRSGGSFNRVGLEDVDAIQRGIRRNAHDIDAVVPSSDDAPNVGSVTVEVLAGTAECIE